MKSKKSNAVKGDALVANFVAETKWDALPDSVQRKARMCLFDSLGATLVGTLTRISRITADYAARTWPGDEATILLHGKRASAVGSAFANGYAANGVDIDDCGQYTKGHPGAQIFPTALAVAEKLELDGAQMMCAMVVGYEVAHRTGRCWHDYHRTYQACGSWGSIACACVAASLMGLPSEQIVSALGIAEYHAPNLPMMRDIANPAMVKHGIGWGAMTGVISAELAAQGFTGIPSILGFEKYRDWVSGIGQEYIMVDGVTWKKYASCAWTHAALKGTELLMKTHNIQVEDIARIRIESPYEAVELGTRLPTTTEEAQFNLAWPLAALLVDGEVGPDQMLEHRLSDPRIRNLVRRTEAVASEELTQRYSDILGDDSRGKYGSVVVITLKDGRELNSGVVESDMSYPQQGWDERRVEEKFRWLTQPLLGEARTSELIEMIWRFEEVPSVRELTRMLA
jgi:2-methylcitrate dehydratase PrpD